MIGQSEVEKAFVKTLDIDVKYSSEVSSINETPELAEITVGGQRVFSRYIIAADGGQSPIRKQLGIGFEGNKPNMCWAVLDTFIKTDFPVCNEIISFEENGQSRVSWIPRYVILLIFVGNQTVLIGNRERGMARFYILLEGEVTQERSEESVRRHMAPYTVDFLRTEWFSTYNGLWHLIHSEARSHNTVQERVATSFTSPLSKIFLAGDAGHIHAVNGGQGLNTGIADAFAIVWRVAIAVALDSCGSPSQRLLASYDIERRITAQTVVDTAGKLVRSTLRTAQEYVALIEKNAAQITGMGIVYAPNNITVVEGAFGDFIAGGRFPDISFVKSHSINLRLYELVEYGAFVVFTNGVSFDTPDWAANQVETWKCESTPEGYTVITAARARLTTDFVFPEEAAVIMRPDLYVGYIGKDPESYFRGY